MAASAVPPLRILVVDDEEMVRDTLKLLLRIDHHAVEMTDNAIQALAVFQPGKYDLVITDYDMPGMKGDALVSAIKALSPTQAVVMLTAYAEAVQKAPALLKNLDGLIPKPFELETLRDTIASALAAKGLPGTTPGP